jgi:hypothetical protein
VDGQAVHSGQFVGERTPDGAGDAGDEDSHRVSFLLSHTKAAIHC